MSKSQSPERVAELRDIFVTVTGDESITESQTDEQTDRELDPDEEFDPEEVADGLDDAVAGSETSGGSDPAA